MQFIRVLIHLNVYLLMDRQMNIIFSYFEFRKAVSFSNMLSTCNQVLIESVYSLQKKAPPPTDNTNTIDGF